MNVQQHHINIAYECCICFDNMDDFIMLTCCSRNIIHKKCLFITFLNFSYFPFERTMPCPLCRGSLNITDYFSLNDILILFSNLDMLSRKLHLNRVQIIIKQFYLNSEMEYIIPSRIEVDDTTSLIRIVSFQLYLKKYIVNFILLSLTIACIILSIQLLVVKH
jgi:hypothetical protein